MAGGCVPSTAERTEVRLVTCPPRPSLICFPQNERLLKFHYRTGCRDAAKMIRTL